MIEAVMHFVQLKIISGIPIALIKNLLQLCVFVN